MFLVKIFNKMHQMALMLQDLHVCYKRASKKRKSIAKEGNYN